MGKWKNLCIKPERIWWSYEQTINVNKAISVTFVAGTDVGSVNELSKNGITILAAATESDFSRNDNYRIYSGKNVTISASRENIVKIKSKVSLISFGFVLLLIKFKIEYILLLVKSLSLNIKCEIKKDIAWLW